MHAWRRCWERDASSAAISAGQRHLRAARSLFADAGADAWLSVVDMRLARLAAPLERCRAAWESLLTERELEVAMRVVEGASNRELATQLDVSVRTIEVHVGRILSKLEVRSRVALTGLAHRTDQYA